MIEGERYIEIIKLFYSFLEIEFNFKIVNETISGNVFYDVEFKNKDMVISISYENIEDYVDIIVFILESDKMPNYDDKAKTLHLNQLNKQIVTRLNKEKIDLNVEYFTKYNVQNAIERKLLQMAKELRLCLKYFNELQLTK